MTASLYALQRALRDMEDGDVLTFSYPDMRTTDVAREAKSFALRHGFSVSVRAGYGGVDVEKRPAGFRINIERAIIRMRSGQVLEIQTKGFEVPTVRDIIHKFNKTGAVRIDAEFTGKALRITRTDLIDRPESGAFAPILAGAAQVFDVPIKPMSKQKQFAAELWLCALLAHQPMDWIRISESQVEAFQV